MGKALAKRITGISRTAKVSLVLVCTVLTSAFVCGGWSQPDQAAAAATVLHNSQITGSTKWVNGWGITGGQYGAFTCATCHNQTTPNIKRVAAKLPAIFAPISTITFKSTTTPNGFGDDTVAHTTSAKVCEVCHTKTKYHNFNTANNTGGLVHNNNSDCVATCHPHSVGFKPAGGTCDSCHGDPPTTATSGGPTGLATNALPSGQAGAHAKHVTTKGMLCVACHNGYATKAMPSATMDMGFAITPTNAPFFTGTVTTGGYVGNSSITGIVWTAGSTGTTVTTAAGVNTCAVYCHGSTLTPANSAASWVGGTIEAACGACHGTSSATPPTTANHLRHAGAAAGQLALTCDKCHGAHPDNSHVNGSVKWDLHGLGTGKYKTPTLANYTATGATGALAPSASYGTCNTIYCHSNSGPNATAKVYATPTWGGTTLTCGDCHANMRTVASTVPNGGHYDHSSTGNTTGPQFDCALCHSGYTASSVTAATHANSQVNLTFAANATTTYTKSSPMPVGTAWGTCSASACHGTATGLVWGGALYKAGTDACSTCHSSSTAGAVTTATPFYSTSYPTKVTANTNPKVGAHTSHVAGVDSLSSSVTCAACHGTVTYASATHMVGSTTFTWSTLATKNGTLVPSYNATTGQCSNVYCHGASMPNGDVTGSTRAPTWTSTLPATLTSAACGSCHGFPPSTASGHPVVTLPTGFPTSAAIGATCNCHANINPAGNSYATMFVNKSLHINGIFEPPSGGDCTTCHNAQQGTGTRRVVGTDTVLASHHIQATTINAASCSVCHEQTTFGHMVTGDVAVGMLNQDTGAALTYDGTTATALNLETSCNSCHDANGASRLGTKALTPFSDSGDNTRPPFIGWSTGKQAHSASMACFNCHGNSAGVAGNTLTPKYNAHGSATAKMLQFAYTATDTMTTTTNFCYNCHGTTIANGVTSPSIQAAVNLSTTIGHKTAKCSDCHDQHSAKPGLHTATTMAPVLNGVAGKGAWPATNPAIATTWTGLGTLAVTYTATSEATAEWQICFKCHAGTVPVPTGYTVGALRMTDIGLEFNPANKAGHPVVTNLNGYTGSAAPKPLAAGNMVAPWTAVGTQVMTCSDCHGATGTGAQGPHGSSVRWMLTGANQAWPFTTTAGNGTATGTPWMLGNATSGTAPNKLFCLNCHVVAGTNGVHRNAGSSGQHTSFASTNRGACVSCHIRVPHGGKVARLLRCDSGGVATLGRYAPNGTGAEVGTTTTQVITKYTKGSSTATSAIGSFSGAGCTTHSGGTDTW